MRDLGNGLLRSTAPSPDVERDEPRELQEIRNVARQRCIDRVKAATEHTILSRADVRAYEEQVLSEWSLELVGKRSHEEKLAALREDLHTLIPQLIDDARILKREFERLLGEARRSGGVSETSIAKWVKRLKDETVIYHKKKEFIRESFPEYVGNWVRLGTDLKTIAEKRKALGLEGDTFPELAAVTAQGFHDAHYRYKRDRADAALAALAAYEKGEYRRNEQSSEQGLFVEARAKLQQAVEDRALASWKVGVWLRRIFESDTKPLLIKEFVRGNGPKSLNALIRNWKSVSERFFHIELLRSQKGSPRSFNFVHLDVFLGWHLMKRRAYVEQAEYRFTDINTEREDFLRIRHALDVKDWEEADELIAAVPRGVLTPEESTKLRSMEKYLREHRGKKSERKEGSPRPEGLLHEARTLLDDIPTVLQPLYAEAMQRGYNFFWVLCTLLRNRDWCHAHHYLTEEKELTLYRESRLLTANRIRFGHDRGFEANDLTRGRNNQYPAVRNQAGINAAQVLFMDSASTPTILGEIEEQGQDRNFWYWATLVPLEIPIGRHQQLVWSINPRLKRLIRQMDRIGLIFTTSGDPQYRPTVGTYEKAMRASPN